MRRTSPSRLILSILFVCAVLLAIPVAGLLLLSAGPFEEVRRKAAEYFLSEAIDVPVEVKGPVEIGFSLEPTVTLQDIVAVESGLPSDMKTLSIKGISVEVPLLPLLIGHLDLSGLTVDGLKVAIDIPEGRETEVQGVAAIAGFVSNVVHSAASSNFELRDTALDLTDEESGFTVRYGFDAVISKAKADGSIEVDAQGNLNGEPWKFGGDVKPLADGKERTFDFTAQQAGLSAALSGDYTFGSVGDVVDLKVTAKAPSLEQFLAVYEIKGSLLGTGDLSGRISGPIEALKLSDLMLKLGLDSGDVYTLSGGIDDLSAATGFNLVLDGEIPPPKLSKGEKPPLFDVAVTGFTGRLEGSHLGVLVRDFRIRTNALNATVNDIGPITAERLYKDKDGRLGLYDLLILAGDAKRPSLRITGTVRDVIDFKGVDLKGKIDIPTADVFDLIAEKRVTELGHLTGDIALSDADGSLGLESLSAKVTDSKLIKLGVDLVFDDVRKADELKLATHLDIPDFESLAEALGSKVADIGSIKFDGTVSGSNKKIEMAGTALAGQTTIKGALSGAFTKDKPSVSGSISSPLLHLGDMRKLHAVGVTYMENVDHKDVDAVDYSKALDTVSVDLKIDVAKIAGGGSGASHIKGRVAYLEGVVGLDPLSLTYLGGRATASGKIDTGKKPSTFAMKGRVESLRIGTILKEMKVDFPVRGSINVKYDLSGSGNSLVEISRTLSGSATSSVRDGWVGSDLINLTGMSVPAWLLSRGRGGGAELVCVVAPFGFNKGRGTTHGLVFQTREVQIVGVGYVDLRRDAIDLRFKPQPMRRELIKVTQPFAIQGRLSHPQLRLEGAPVLSAVAGTLAFPFNALDRIIQPRADAPDRRPCQIIRTSTRESREAERGRGGRGPLGLGILGREGERGTERERRPAREGLFGRERRR